MFAFGHGLSYTTFKLGKATADKADVAQGDSITFTLDVTNTGERAGAGATVRARLRVVARPSVQGA